MSGCDRLIVPRLALEGLVRRARSEAPAEIVGFLAGGYENGAARATRDVPLPNRSPDGTAFLADPFVQFLTEKEIAARSEEIVAIYHSHPQGDGAFSDLDAVFAGPWRCAHLIVGLHPIIDARAYWSESQMAPIELLLVDWRPDPT